MLTQIGYNLCDRAYQLEQLECREAKGHDNMSILDDYLNPKVDVGKLNISKIICYRVRQETCYGRIAATHLESLGAVRVEPLEYGYEGEYEYVYIPDITAILPDKVEPQYIKQGSIIRYRLPSSDSPTRPCRVWRGKVLLAYGNDWNSHIYKVGLLVPGYDDCTERVTLSQVVLVEVIEGANLR